MTIRKATIEDISSILEIIKQAQTYFKENNINQWQNGYPNYNTIETDIKNLVSYVALHEDKIVGTFMVTSEEEITYNKIYDGKWLTQSDYMVIHRIAVDNTIKGKGLSGFIINHIVTMAKNNQISSIRIDTHEENKSMLKTLIKNDFTECGTIYLVSGAKRIAFEKLI